jgi:hypothetical protein
MAVINGQLESVQILRENGAELDYQNKNGCTPLWWAGNPSKYLP